MGREAGPLTPGQHVRVHKRRSHPVSVEVREFDWDSSRKGASRLSRTKTIRLSTPKTTTGEILIFALTSPLSVCTVAGHRVSTSRHGG